MRRRHLGAGPTTIAIPTEIRVAPVTALARALALAVAGPAAGPARATESRGETSADPLARMLSDGIRKIQEALPAYFSRARTDRAFVAAMNGLLREIDPSGGSFVAQAAPKDPAGPGGKQAPQIRIRFQNGLPVVSSVVVHSEASMHDVRPGDLLVRIDGEIAPGRDLPAIEASLAGAPGSTVTVGVLRPRDNQYREVTLKREAPAAAAHARRIGPRIGYVQVNLVDEASIVAYEAKLSALARDGLSGIILDLRGTCGGGVDQALRLVDPLLPGSDRIVARIQDPKGQRSVAATAKTTHIRVPVVVLQDPGTQAAAEIAAAALQDNRRAILLGETTAGAGTYDAPRPIAADHVAQIATTYVSTSRGAELMGKGVAPDIAHVPDAVPPKAVRRFREEFSAFCRGAPAPKAPPPGSAASTPSTTGTPPTTATPPTAPTTATPPPSDAEDDEEEPARPGQDGKPEGKVPDQLLGEYALVRAHDSTLVRAVNLLVSADIFFKQLLQND
jgi:carboxyl-terminal processing protease